MEREIISLLTPTNLKKLRGTEASLVLGGGWKEEAVSGEAWGVDLVMVVQLVELITDEEARDMTHMCR